MTERERNAWDAMERYCRLAEAHAQCKSYDDQHRFARLHRVKGTKPYPSSGQDFILKPWLADQRRAALTLAAEARKGTPDDTR